MPRLSPFTGLVFNTAVAGPLEIVTAPPYDVISDRRRLDHLRASPFSVVHLDLAEGAEDPTHPANRYSRAARLLVEWESQGALQRAPEPCYYAYEMTVPPRGGRGSPTVPGRTVHGLICAMEIEDWGGTVLPHEDVHDAPVEDRLALLRATRTHLSPVYGVIEDSVNSLAAMSMRPSGPAPFDAVDEQGVRHRMWPIVAHAALTARLENLGEEALLIADGHHRYTTALRYRAERHRDDGPGPWDSVLTLVVDSTAEHLQVMPFHRVQMAGDAPPATGMSMLGLAETLSPLRDEDLTVGTISRDARGEVEYRVRHVQGQPPTVRALHEDLLDTLAPRDSLRYVVDAGEADESVRRGEAVAAYLLPPTTPRRIRNVVERGERLPQKSTYFWPKPRTGMVMMPLGPAGRADPAGRAS